MKKYDITGMSCAACSARVEKAVKALSGVDSCAVSLLTNSMSVEGDVAPDKVIAAVERAGYGAELSGGGAEKGSRDDIFEDKETPAVLRRLIASLVFLVALMYISMGHVMWGWPLPPILADNHLAIGLLQLLLTATVMVINQRFFISGFKGLLRGAPNMDTLVSLGAGAAFIYSTYVLFSMTSSQLSGDLDAVAHGLHGLYFESAAMILTLITVGKMLEAKAKGRTTDALRGLVDLAPQSATVIRDGVEIKIAAEELRKGDIFVVHPGEHIPTDGIVLDGISAVNESALTGESIPVDKKAGDKVSGATLNQSGFLRCEATRVGEDTMLSQIIKMVSDAASTKAPIAKAADKVSGVFVPIVMSIAVIATVAWLIAGEGIGFALARGISVLVISCPCALGLATPVAIMVGNGMGAKHGILFKNATALEQTGKTDIVVLDKTGTVTRGEPTVTDVIPAEGIKKGRLVSLAYSLEYKSEHPLAGAIKLYAQDEGAELLGVSNFKALSGNGVEAVLYGEIAYGGKYDFISGKVNIPSDALEESERLAQEGKTPLFFACGEAFLGIVAVADTIKEESRAAVRELENMGLRVVMLTGDHKRTAKAIGSLAGIDEVIAEVMPDGKDAVIQDLRRQGRVIMVGDGINDAPALTRADIGIAIGAGTDVAIDAADVVLMNSKLSDVPAAIKLSRATLRNIHENLFWAFFYNAIGIPLAAGLFIPMLGWQLEPMFGAAAMSLSSFCVVMNALRLNLFNVNKPVRHKRSKNKSARPTAAEKERIIMEKTLKIEGMMCPHCEARVKKCLEELDGVTEATVSHKEGTATVRSTAEISDELLKNTVEAQGYKVL